MSSITLFPYTTLFRSILYEMLTGQVPFQGPNVYAVMNARLVGDPPAPRSYNTDIPPPIEEIVLHAMERDQSKRYHSASEMKDRKSTRLNSSHTVISYA